MSWFTRKKPVETPTVTDDWAVIHGPWREVELCHCGRDRYDPPTSYGNGAYYTVCPKCGHVDKWEKFVARWVHERSEGRFKARLCYDEYVRNEHHERWKPESCEVEDDRP